MITLDDDREVLTIDGEEFRGDFENEFEVLAIVAEPYRLSDLPTGVTVVLCDPVGGSSELAHRAPPCFLEHTSDESFVGRSEAAFFVDDPRADAEARAEYHAKSIADGLVALQPLIDDGTILVHRENTYDDIAFIEYAVKLDDQLLLDAEQFMDAINARVYEGMDRDLLFLCHASEDEAFAERLVRELDRRALHAWFDKREVLVGDSIVDRVNSGLKRARFLVAVLSPRSVCKPWVRREMNSSLMRQLVDERIRVLPVLLETCELPPLLADLKFADFRVDFEDGFRSLMAAIRDNGRSRSAG